MVMISKKTEKKVVENQLRGKAGRLFDFGIQKSKLKYNKFSCCLAVKRLIGMGLLCDKTKVTFFSKPKKEK